GLSYQQQKDRRIVKFNLTRNIKSSVICRAEELRFRLDAKYPSFTKYLLRSHVASCFWMGLPLSFCKMYLPQTDTYFILLNQNGKRYTAKYLPRKTALSGGWRGFSIAEELSEGDALVFQLLQPTKLKVVFQIYVAAGVHEQATETHRSFSVSATAQDKEQPQASRQAEKSENKLKHALHPAAVGDCGISSFEEFAFLINESLKEEYELPHNIKCSYYQLCCSQNTLLHFHLLKGINPLLIAGSIIETVNVAAAIKNCELHDFLDELPIWDEKLRFLNILGMKVGFLMTHLDHLQRITNDPEVAKNRQQYLDLCSEQADSGNKIQNLEAKLSELTKAVDKRADDIHKLKLEIENHKSRFLEQ
ncbi:hypothetical protein RDABS01_004941, partial [Bienertia sinuspersici]